jgi:phosphatidylglycerol:prolipoprotein diacylglycerol transferase
LRQNYYSQYINFTTFFSYRKSINKVNSFSSQKITILDSMFLFVHWLVNPDIPLPFHLITVQWYGLMWTLSIFGCFFLGRWILNKENLSEEHLVLIIQYIFIGAIVGARLGQALFYDLSFFMSKPLEIFQVWHGGLSSHGGVVGGLAGLYLFQRAHPQYGLVWLFDRVAVIIYLPCSLIRFGNLMNSELIGKVTDVPWAFYFPGETMPRHPVVLYESICYFILLIIIICIYRQMGSKRPGFYMAFFFTFTFLTRFLLEFMKEPEGSLHLGPISKTQLLSLPLILVGVIMFIFAYKNKSNKEEGQFVKN